jgi:hypothetical protein
MNTKDILYHILLNLDINDLNPNVNKLFSNVLNDEHFWCEWLDSYNIYPIKNYKYIATHYDLTKDNWYNLNIALQNDDLIMLEYLFRIKINDTHLIYIINKNSKKVLRLALEYIEPTYTNILYAVAIKHYSLLKMLMIKYNYQFKNEVIELININKQYIYMSEESITIENQIDQHFQPHTNLYCFRAWRNQHFSSFL